MRPWTVWMVAALALTGCVQNADVLPPPPERMVVEFLKAPDRGDPGPVFVEFLVEGAEPTAVRIHWGPDPSRAPPFAYAHVADVPVEHGFRLARLDLTSGTWWWRVEVEHAGGAHWSGERRIDVRPAEGQVVVRAAPDTVLAGEPARVVTETRGLPGGTRALAWVEWAAEDGAVVRGATENVTLPGPVSLPMAVEEPGRVNWRVVVAVGDARYESPTRTLLVRGPDDTSIVILAYSTNGNPGEPSRVSWRIDGVTDADVTTRLHWGPRSSSLPDPEYAERSPEREGVVGTVFSAEIPAARGHHVWFRVSAETEGRTLWSSEYVVVFR